MRGRHAGRSALGALVVLGALGVTLNLPNRAVHLQTSSARMPIAGAVHVHTTRSDGTGSVDEVAAAAVRAHLQFVVVTDHGDGTRPPDPPSYRSGVLVLDAAEISAVGGHYVVMDLPQAPYPLAGELRDVADDVRRLGGVGIAAHGDSPKRDLQWLDTTVPVDGLEWLNLDSEWRRSSRPQIARAFLGYLLRPPEAIGSLLSRPSATLARFDAAASTRRIIAIAATDAHTRMLPSYEACFSTVTTRLELEEPLSGDANADARLVLSALRAGHHFTVIDALATPADFSFTARRNGVIVRQGDGLPAGDALTFDAAATAPAGARLVLLRNGIAVADTDGSPLSYQADGRRAAYRVEVRLADAPGRPRVPWIVSNPIYVGIDAEPGPGVLPASGAHPSPSDPMLWTVEHDRTSTADLVRNETADNPALTLRYRLGPGRPADQFSALVGAVRDGLAGSDRVTFTAHASRPLRVSVQLRPAGGNNPPRWQRSIYLDRSPRTVTVFFDDMHAVPREVTGAPPLASIGALMFVIDTNNTAPETSGDVVFTGIGVGRVRDARP